jgi:hypothetical protein
MAYSRGDSKNIIIGAAAIFTTKKQIDPEKEALTTPDASYLPQVPDFEDQVPYVETLSANPATPNAGYTSNGLEMTFTPNFGEVSVDQLLDSAKLFKQGMQVELKTGMAESTLENLLFAIAGASGDLVAGTLSNPTDKSIKTPAVISPGNQPMAEHSASNKFLELSSGKLGECPVERGIIAVGPGPGECGVGEVVERIYIAYRALSMSAVTVNIKRDAASVFDVTFRLLPANNGSYGRIIDRVVAKSSAESATAVGALKPNAANAAMGGTEKDTVTRA